MIYIDLEQWLLCQGCTSDLAGVVWYWFVSRTPTQLIGPGPLCRLAASWDDGCFHLCIPRGRLCCAHLFHPSQREVSVLGWKKFSRSTSGPFALLRNELQSMAWD